MSLQFILLHVLNQYRKNQYFGGIFSLKKLVEILRDTAENYRKVNFVAVAQVLHAPDEVNKYSTK